MDYQVPVAVLQKHMERFPEWKSILEVAIEENLYVIFPAWHSPWSSHAEQECDMIVYEPGVKGEDAVFHVEGNIVECVNYPGSYKPHGKQQFIEMLREIKGCQYPNDSNLTKLLKSE